MKITALKNFKANGVEASPGQVLTDEQYDQIYNILPEMKQEGLILCEDGSGVPEEPSNEGMIDEGPNAKDELTDSPSDASGDDQAPQAPQSNKKKKKS